MMGEVMVTQYLRPDGRQRPIPVEVPDDVMELAARNRMELSIERINAEQVALYVRRADQPEEEEAMEIAQDPGGGLTDLLVRMIKAAAV
jgi:hypothetical protein